VNDKQILITGSTNGIGLAAAEALAALGANLAIVGRSKTRTRIASARIRAAAGREATVATFIADLSSQASVRRLAAEVLARYPKLDVLVNNAGAMYGTRQLTKDGIELTWAVNHLAPFLLSKLLLHRLKESAPARIITTASQAHQGAHIPFDDLNAERSYRGFGRYCETKLANILFTTELARRLDGTGVTANCFYPGLVATVPRRDGSGSKEQAHLSLCQEGFTPPCRPRSKDPIDLPVRCGLPRTRSRCRPRAAGLQHRSYAASPR
jgi:NAD(P)-dependent dehydrogenase (short-subunit alcohol dehydrogenase family)